MKRLLCLMLAMVLLLCACGKKEAIAVPEVTNPVEEENFASDAPVRIAEEVVFDSEHYDWQTLLLADAFNPGTPIGDAGLAAVQLTVDEITQDSLTITVTAPQVAQELWQWYQQEDGADLEAKILELLKGQPKAITLTLSYRVRTDGTPVVDYTGAFASAVTCGLSDFYDLVQADMVQEMEEQLW